MVRPRSLVLWSITFLIIVGAVLAGGLTIRASVSTSIDRAAHIRTARQLLFDAIRAQLDEETSVRGYAATRDATFLQPYQDARVRLPAILTRLAAALGPLHSRLAADAVSDASRTNARWLQSVAAPLTTGRPRAATAIQRKGKALVDRFRVDGSRVEDALAELEHELTVSFQRDLAQVGAFVVGAAVLLFLFGMLFTLLQAQALESLDRERADADDARERAAALHAAYQVEKRIADTIQDAILQRELPTLPSMRFSATYTPATEATKVGGDWYDAFELDAGRILFTIGDIAGHGIDAAVAMNRVRNSVLSAALYERDAASILARVNREIVRGGIGPMVTAVVGIADSNTCEFEYAAAGHPPPVLLEPGRAPRLLEFGSLPLGVDASAEYRTHRVQSEPGAMLVLYTDGAIEHSRDVLEGESLLLEAVAGVAESSQADPAAAIYRSIFDGNVVGDDVAILTVGFAANAKSGFTVSAEQANSSLAGSLARSPAASGPPFDLVAEIRRRRQVLRRGKAS